MPPIILQHKPIQQVIWIFRVAKKKLCQSTLSNEIAGIIKDYDNTYEGTCSQD